jgi:hypothetical protein
MTFAAAAAGGPQGAQGYGGAQGPQGSTGPIGVSTYYCQGKLYEPSGNQLVSTSSDVIIQFVDDLDPNNWLSNHVFQPNVAGHYLISLYTWLTPGSGSGQNNCQINKNATTQIAIYQNTLPTGTVGISIGGTKLVYLNGTTDFLQFTVYSNSATDQYLQYGSGTYFTAILTSISV